MLTFSLDQMVERFTDRKEGMEAQNEVMAAIFRPTEISYSPVHMACGTFDFWSLLAKENPRGLVRNRSTRDGNVKGRR